MVGVEVRTMAASQNQPFSREKVGGDYPTVTATRVVWRVVIATRIACAITGRSQRLRRGLCPDGAAGRGKGIDQIIGTGWIGMAI